jgi:16S rRNA processing protein RimM
MVGGQNLLPIGRVLKHHGLRGQIKISYFGGDLDGFRLYREVLIEDSQGIPRSYEIEEVIPHPPGLILRLKGIGKREEAHPLLGKEILVREEALPELKDKEYFWFEILGLTVETGEGKKIGKVKEVIPTGAHDVFVVEGKRRDILLPATERVVRSIDREKRVMKVHWMEGLWEKEDEV